MPYIYCLIFFLIFFLISICHPIMSQEAYPYKFEGVFENYCNNRLTLISHYLPYNPIVLESGAYDGTDTVRLSNQWPVGKVLAFEPNLNAFQKLQAKTNHLQNVSLYDLALSNKEGLALFYICHGTDGKSPEFEGSSSLLPPSKQMEIHYQGPKITVSCVVLDDWCKKNKVDHIDFMWLNLEGFELQVLKSSPHILKKVKVIYTKTNFFPFRIGTTQYQDLRKFLEKSGFTLLSHWYREGLQGDAIFIRKEIYNSVFQKTSE